MKICKKCHTKNDNRKKKCTYCGNSLKDTKIQEDNYIYRPIYKGTNDIVEHTHEVKLKNLSEHFFMFVITYFLVSNILNVLCYFTIDKYLINLDILGTTFIHYSMISIVNIIISTIISLLFIFKFGTLYEDDVRKFMILINGFYILYSIYLGAIEYMKYSNLYWSILVTLINALIFIISTPVIYTNLKEKLL